MIYRLTTAERDTILAALRFYQSKLPLGEVGDDVLEIAADSCQPLDPEAIDGLCEALNG